MKKQTDTAECLGSEDLAVDKTDSGFSLIRPLDKKSSCCEEPYYYGSTTTGHPMGLWGLGGSRAIFL